MASINGNSVLVVLFLTCGAVMATKENDQIIKENNLENPLFKDLSPTTIIAKSMQTWNNCLVLIYSPSPSA
ncbi:hypothetical protein ES332_D05G374400v1 [Gossypium tomentosum]|uniref:Uncharacterized protein n=1 Tax=Gossypium tomentosum TaxID=34277 RepID=A0A5D2L4I6_GOSTO|nr:hypothetical protein ES332_D05G374400v1 [Gossypium tomentosum]